MLTQCSLGGEKHAQGELFDNPHPPDAIGGRHARGQDCRHRGSDEDGGIRVNAAVQEASLKISFSVILQVAQHAITVTFHLSTPLP